MRDIVAIVAGTLLFLVCVVGGFALSTAIIFCVWNYLVVWAFPTLPLVTWGQAIAVAVVWALFSAGVRGVPRTK